MGSFNYNDDYSVFNNLLERSNYLTEAGKIGGAHPSFGGLAGRLEREVGKGFPRDVRIFIAELLYDLNIFKGKDMDYLRSTGGAAGKGYREALEELLDAREEEIKKRSDEIGDAVEDRFQYLVNINVTRMGETKVALKKAELEATKAAKAVQKEIRGGKDLDDSVSDNQEKLFANVAVYTTLTNAQGRVSDKALDTVEKYAVEYVNSFNDLDVLVKKLKTFDNEDFNMLADELSNSLSSVKSRAGVSEDNEDPYAGVNDPGDSGNSYEGGVAGQNISEIEDEEDQAKEGHLVFLLRFKGSKSERPWPHLIDTHGNRTALMHKDDSSFDHSSLRPFHRKYVRVSGKPDPKRGDLVVTDVTEAPDPFAGISAREDKEEVISREGLNNNMRKRKLLFEKRKNWGKFRSNRKQKLVVEKDLDAAERRALPDSDFALPGKGKGPEGKQAGAYPINDEEHARLALSMVAQHGTPEEKKKVRAAVARKYPDITQEEEEEKQYDATNVQLMKLIQNDIMNGMTAKESIEGLGVDPAYHKDLFRRYLKWADSWSEGPIEPESWFENEEVRADLQQGPMLDSYQSDTSGYLSEQVTKDKRYKRPEVKNQSFKEKYKPKTHWQLEELRRMGL